MVYKSFRFRLILRILLVVAVALLIAYSFLVREWIITGVLASGVLIIQVTELVWFTDKTNRELSRFLTAIKYRDLSQTFTGEEKDHSLHELRSTFNTIIQEFRKLGYEREEHHRYLQTVVEHVSIGLLAFDSNGEVELMNKAVKELLHTPYLKNIRGLEKISNELADRLLKLKPGEQQLVKIAAGGEVMQLSVHAAGFRMNAKDIKLVSLQNIRSELDEKELEAWQKLIRVLTHEIMNSVTPVKSLTGTITEMLEEDGRPVKQLDPESIEDIYNALKTIEKRSQGLLNFVEIYRNLARVPKPSLEHTEAGELLQNVYRLLKTELEKRNISFSVNVKEGKVHFYADPSLVEQVLINLLLNAMDAVEGVASPVIEMKAWSEKGRAAISVQDNGQGMNEETASNIFVPFFTTKEKGSGIGLSLSQQIMRLHSGSISVQSAPGKGSLFTLRF